MIIDNKKIAKIEVLDPQGNTILEMDDDGATKAPGYEVNVYLDTRLGPDALVKQNDMLHYYGEENIHYTVIRADVKFFTMAPVSIAKDNTVKINLGKQRTYPNNRKVGTLKDYGLILEYVEKEGAASAKET